jgi:prepilin-type N-terminal cleavage/methylation domain-containing protein
VISTEKANRGRPRDAKLRVSIEAAGLPKEKMHETSRRTVEGFTLTELLIVVTLIGLLAAIAAPYVDIGRYRSESAMQTVGTTLLAAQRLAVTRQHDVVVSFDAANSIIRVHQDANNNNVVDPGEIERFYSLGEQIAFGRAGVAQLPFGPGPITFTELRGGLPIVTFHRDGSASEAGGGYLYSQNPGRRGLADHSVRAFQIERATGRTSWYRFTASGWTRGF